MPDFLQRDQAPLSGDQWTALDQAVVQTARAILVGRRFISLVGPFGPGVEALPSDSLAGTAAGQIDLLGNAAGEAIGIQQRRYLPLPLIYKDFWVHWRDLEANHHRARLPRAGDMGGRQGPWVGVHGFLQRNYHRSG